MSLLGGLPVPPHGLGMVLPHPLTVFLRFSRPPLGGRTAEIRGEASWGALTKTKQREMDEVLRLWRSAAEQGHAGAQCNLGVMYENGQGVKQDHAEAVRWYRKAAEQGLVYAVSALKRLFVGVVTSNASPSTPKVIAPATGRVCSNC